MARQRLWDDDCDDKEQQINKATNQQTQRNVIGNQL